ncbi:MAG: hypothetical protein KF703_08215 [Actinobacteria bacterium]|nr:hypothetical protein [Actinomycetota bacterium]
MRPSRGSLPDRYAAAAYDQFVARGAQRLPTVGSLSSVAAAIGASRSQLYRHWETAADLDADVTAHLATTRLGWAHHLDLEPDEPFGDAIGRLVASPGLCSGAAIWPAIAAEPAGSALRHRAAAFEGGLLARLARHLERTSPVRVHHPVPWTDLAVTIAVILHGSAACWSVIRDNQDDLVDDEIQDLLVELVTDLHERFPSLVSGPDRPLSEPEHPDPAGHRPAGAVRLLDRIADTVEGGELGLDPSQRRLVGVDDLARSLDVTPRHLFEVWPTAGDMNLAIAAEGFERLLDGYDRLTDHLVEALGDGSAAGPDDAALVELLARQVDPIAYPEGHHQLALFAAAADPDLAPAGRHVLRSWLLELGPRVSAAALHLTDRRLRAGRSLFDYGVQSGVKNVGSWVELGLHDGLLERRVTLAGQQVSAIGVGLHLVPGALLDGQA